MNNSKRRKIMKCPNCGSEIIDRGFMKDILGERYEEFIKAIKKYGKRKLATDLNVPYSTTATWFCNMVKVTPENIRKIKEMIDFK